MHVTFLGIGLIGGSVARALRSAGGWTAAAWTPSGRGPAAAVAAGVVDSAPARFEDALVGADLIVLAASPTACLELLDRIGTSRASLAEGAVITDVASTKVRLVERAAALGLRFVGGHPMAGREAAGFEAATGYLFRDRPWVVVPGEGVGSAAGSPDEDAIARVEALARATGARPVRLEAAVHDRAVAAISHLPLVASVALVEAVAGTGAVEPNAGDPAAATWAVAASLAAGGWRDMTRLARGDAAMGAGIAVTNAATLAAALRAYRARLDEWLVLLEFGVGGSPALGDTGSPGPDEAALRSRFEAARHLLGEQP